MRIKSITDECILFDNGSRITFDHNPDCCEYNYADFTQLADTGIELDTFNEPLVFEALDTGFRFGNKGKMYYVPCYSSQNGYYSLDVDIYLNDKRVLEALCEME